MGVNQFNVIPLHLVLRRKKSLFLPLFVCSITHSALPVFCKFIRMIPEVFFVAGFSTFAVPCAVLFIFVIVISFAPYINLTPISSRPRVPMSGTQRRPAAEEFLIFNSQKPGITILGHLGQMPWVVLTHILIPPKSFQGIFNKCKIGANFDNLLVWGESTKKHDFLTNCKQK